MSLHNAKCSPFLWRTSLVSPKNAKQEKGHERNLNVFEEDMHKQQRLVTTEIERFMEQYDVSSSMEAKYRIELIRSC